MLTQSHSIFTATLRLLFSYYPFHLCLGRGSGVKLCCLLWKLRTGSMGSLLFSHSAQLFFDPMDCSTPGFPVLLCLPELAQTHVHWVVVDSAISFSVTPFSSCPQSFPALGSFLMSLLFASGGLSTGDSAWVFPMNVQDWFPLGLTLLIS